MNNTPNILLVDDELRFSEMTREYLVAKGCNVILKHTADMALTSFKCNAFDLCILDIKMPFKDGFQLASEIREIDEQIPFIFLTGQVRKEDRLKGLGMGADDYITKPFSMEELFLRIKNIIKRTQLLRGQPQEKLRFDIGGFHFEATTRELCLGDEIVKLTAIEARLLQMFCENENGVVERNLALKRIWGDADYLRGRSLNVYVSKLRTYLKKTGEVELLNVHGVGYKMVVTPKAPH